jgi:hypothetical protein
MSIADKTNAMSKTANNIGQICTKEEFERFKSFHELLTEYIEESYLPSKKFEKLFEDISDFETAIVPIAKKVRIDLSEHIATVVEMWEQPELMHPKITCAGWSGDRAEEAIESVCDEYEAKLQDRKEAIADLDKVMVALYASQPKNTETIEPQPRLMLVAFEDALKRVKADLETEQKARSLPRRIIGWTFKKTSHFVGAIVLAVIATIFAAVIVDILADFGWIGRIKEFIYGLLMPE